MCHYRLNKSHLGWLTCGIVRGASQCTYACRGRINSAFTTEIICGSILSRRTLPRLRFTSSMMRACSLRAARSDIWLRLPMNYFTCFVAGDPSGPTASM
jgi:hypothetical protein